MSLTASMTSSEARGSSPSLDAATYFAVFLLALCIRLFWLSYLPLWNDELFSILWSRFDWHFIVGEGTRIETNPPLHFILLKGWIAAFGDSAFSVRLPSALASSLAVVVGYATGRALLTRRAALIGAILLSVAPLSVALAQEARSYAFVELAASVALFAAVRFSLLYLHAGPIRDATSQRWAPRRWPAIGWAGLFATASATAFLFHYTVLFFVLSCLAVVGVRLLIERPLPREGVLIWIGAGAATAALIAIPLVNAMAVSHSGNLAWIDKPTAITTLRFVWSILIGEEPFRGRSAALLTTLAIAGWGLARRYRFTAPALWLLVAVPLLALAMLIAASLTRSLIVPRYAAWLLLPTLLAIAAGLEALPSRIWSRAVVLLVVVGSVAALALQFRAREKEDWRSVADVLAHSPSCTGPVVFDDGSPPFGLAYFDRSLLRRPLWRLYQATSRPTAEHYLLASMAGDRDLPAASLHRFMADHPGAVFVTRRLSGDDPRSASVDRQVGPHTFHRALTGDLQLWCR